MSNDLLAVRVRLVEKLWVSEFVYVSVTAAGGGSAAPSTVTVVLLLLLQEWQKPSDEKI